MEQTGNPRVKVVVVVVMVVVVVVVMVVVVKVVVVVVVVAVVVVAVVVVAVVVIVRFDITLILIAALFHNVINLTIYTAIHIELYCYAPNLTLPWYNARYSIPLHPTTPCRIYHTTPHHTLPYLKHYTTPQCTALHHTTPQCTALHHATPHHTKLHYLTPHHTALPHTTPHHTPGGGGDEGSFEKNDTLQTAAFGAWRDFQLPTPTLDRVPTGALFVCFWWF